MALLLLPLVGWPERPRAHAAGPEGGIVQVDMLDPAFHGFDPTAAYSSAERAVSRLLQRTLLTQRGLPGFEGTRLVPDLASRLPDVSADGLTWTFHLRTGMHYAPPLQDVEVTAPDFVRALERATIGPSPARGGDPVNYGPGWDYLPGMLDGFQAFADGRSSSISGAVALDRYTLQLRTVRPDRSFAEILSLPFSAPIPPSPRSGSPLGIATGHDFVSRTYERSWAGPLQEGFGPFQSATGPYMIEGADRIDYTLRPDQQQSPSGFTPSWWDVTRTGDPALPGRLVLVRNPSWDAASDPARAAYPDRIEITIQPRRRTYTAGGLAPGVDAVIGAAPSPELLQSATPELRAHVARIEGNGTNWVMLNMLQPPLDDVHVRRAFAMALDRAALTDAWVAATGSSGAPASTIVPGALSANLLNNGSTLTGYSTGEARAELQLSRYWGPEGCRGAACRPIRIGGFQIWDTRVQKAVAGSLRRTGLKVRFVPPNDSPDTWCWNGPTKIGACITGWVYDYPAAAAMFPPFRVTPTAPSTSSGIGMSSKEVEAAGFPAQTMPSIEDAAARCSVALAAQAATCWAHLDRWVTDKLVAVVPFSVRQSVRVSGSAVTSAEMDQTTGEFALDRIQVATG